MCGFAGFISPYLSREKKYDVLKRMGHALINRGPDEEGVWLSENHGLGLVHRRLGVIELGPGGRQPMVSVSGRYVLTFNGEIYNHDSLREDLAREGLTFRSHSDTEVLLVALEHWGVDQALKRCIGMFAFALWDCEKCKLTLARDRFGEKPLYYGWQGKSFMFGSTVHALREHPEWNGILNKDALSRLVQHDYIPAPDCIYRGIKKLLPGTWLELSWHNDIWSEKNETYWTAIEQARISIGKPYSGSLIEATNDLEDLIRKVLRGQMLADVPLGAFLSGGIDSSAVVALMQLDSNKPVRTFTIGFDNPAYDESRFAEAVAIHLGTDHTTRMLNESDVFDLITKMPLIFDEPFADSSQLPMALVSQVARKDVTVALSGDGGDEVFGGYNRYLLAEKINQQRRRLPLFARKIISSGIRAVSPQNWNNILQFLPAAHQLRHGGEKLHKLASVISAVNERDVYERLTTFWQDGMPISSGGEQGFGMLDELWSSNFTFQERMMLADTLSYLPDDILVKVDRASMGYSLEARAPFLDQRIFEFVWSLPIHYRIGSQQSKSVLREVLYRHLPRALVERPKTGFSLPIGEYLRGPLRDWAEALLSYENLSHEGYFNVARVRNVWEEHLSGKFNRQYDLWSVLMFQAWRAHWN